MVVASALLPPLPLQREKLVYSLYIKGHGTAFRITGCGQHNAPFIDLIIYLSTFSHLSSFVFSASPSSLLLSLLHPLLLFLLRCTPHHYENQASNPRTTTIPGHRRDHLLHYSGRPPRETSRLSRRIPVRPLLLAVPARQVRSGAWLTL